MCLVTCHNVILASPLPTAWVTGSIQTSRPVPSLPTIPNTSGPNFNSRPCSYVYITNPGAFIFKCSCNFQHVCIKSAGMLRIPAAGSVVPKRQGFQMWRYIFFLLFPAIVSSDHELLFGLVRSGFVHCYVRVVDAQQKQTSVVHYCQASIALPRLGQALLSAEKRVCCEKPLKKGELSFAANCRHEKIMCSWQLKVPY